MRSFIQVAAAFVALAASSAAFAQQAFDRTEDVVYGRKFGVVLTLDVFKPKANPNGLGVVFVVSGGWFSDHANINAGFLTELLGRGYTVFCVVHGSQPKFAIPEILGDMHRSVRFIRFNARRFGVDPERLGITGLSAGGHLSLMQGTAGDAGNVVAKDPIDRVSSRVQAVACFFPPTDFLNYGKSGETAIGEGTLKDFKAPFDFKEFAGRPPTFVSITDKARRLEIGRAISPVTHVTPDDPPSMIIHGDADKLVPIQQAELMMTAFEKAGVPHRLVVRKGAVHGWPTLLDDMSLVADWFDEHLAKKPTAAAKLRRGG